MNGEEVFFVAEAVKLGRSMSYPDMMRFFRGMSYSLADTEATAPFYDVYQRLNTCAEQLDLIASGQLKLELPATPAKGRK